MKPIVVAVMMILAQAPVHAQDVQEVIDVLTGLWARSDASAIALLASRQGMTLDLEGRSIGPLGTRQVSALLKEMFNERETLSVRMKPAQLVGGSPGRAFAEITWTLRARGTTIPERTSVFVALVIEEERWRLTEIRLVRS